MMAAQYPPATPSGRSSSPPSSSPLLSSPLNPSYRRHNPPSQRRPSMKSDYQTRSRYIRFPLTRDQGSFPEFGASAEAEHPQKALWREKLRQQFLQRTQNDRHKYREAKRSSSAQHFRDSSICGAIMDEMDADEMEASDYEVRHSFFRRDCAFLRITLPLVVSYNEDKRKETRGTRVQSTVRANRRFFARSRYGEL